MNNRKWEKECRPEIVELEKKSIELHFGILKMRVKRIERCLNQ